MQVGSQFRNLADGISRQSLALCLEALHTYKVAGFQDECLAEAVVSAKVHLDTRVHLTGQQDKLRMFVVAQKFCFWFVASKVKRFRYG